MPLWLSIIGVAVEVLALALTFSGIVGKWFTAKLNGLGARVEENKLLVVSLTARVEGNEKKILQAELNIGNLQQAIGRIEKSVENVKDMLDKRHEARQAEYGDIKERLIRIESKNDVGAAMEHGLSRIADIMEERDHA